MLENNQISEEKKMFWNGRVVPRNNQVRITGIIEDEFKYDFKNDYDTYYNTRIKVKRLNGMVDFIPIIVNRSFMGSTIKSSLKGKYVQVTGIFGSYGVQGDDGRRHLRMYLYPVALNIYDSEDKFEGQEDRNEIYLEGYICKKPTLKTTTLSKRIIAEAILAVKRFPNRTDYIPLVIWGSEAILASEMEAGDQIKLEGRIQSREYFKSYSPGAKEGEYRTFYEVSVKQILEP